MTKSFLPPPEIFATYPIPNHVNPETRGRDTCIAAMTCAVLSTLFVCLRLFGRLRMKRGLGWDDFWIVFGLVFGICFYLNIILGTQLWGYKYHIWDVPPRLYKGAAIIEITAVLFFLLSTSGIRMSLLSFYLHLVRDAGSVGWKRTIYGFVAVTITISLAFGFTAVFRCTPVSAFWTYPMPEDARCFDESVITLIGGILVVVADLFTMLLPLPVVLSINMPLRQRISVAILLSLGIIVTIVSTTRTVYLWKSLIGTYDITWESHPLLICGSVEVLLSIVCACLPSIKPLYDNFCNYLSRHRNTNAGFRSFLDHTSADGTTAVSSSSPQTAKKPKPLPLSFDVPDAITFGAAKDAMYPLSTLTSINGKMMARVSQEEIPETPSSWVGENGKGSSRGWLSGGLGLPSPTRSERDLQWKDTGTANVGSSAEDEEMGIKVVKSVDVRYSEA